MKTFYAYMIYRFECLHCGLVIGNEREEKADGEMIDHVDRCYVGDDYNTVEHYIQLETVEEEDEPDCDDQSDEE